MSIKLRVAIQKSGRLSEDSIRLMEHCDIKFYKSSLRLRSEAVNFPVEFLYLRDDDIPGYVADGVADVGIVGENVVAEAHQSVRSVEKLGFSKCRLSIAVPKSFSYKTLSDLTGLNIATSYPTILAQYLKQNGVVADIHEISGSVEIAPGIGLADAICDIVSSGSTLLSNGLKEVETIFRSEAVLISQENLSPVKADILAELVFRIQSVQKARDNRYILMNIPNDAIERVIDILPGMKSPTIMPLAIDGWSSLHTVVDQDRFWEVIENVKAAGAEGILVIPIEKMIL